VAIIDGGRLLAIDSPSGLQRAVEQTNRVIVQVAAPAAGLQAALQSVAGVTQVDIRPTPGDQGRLDVECQVDARNGVEAAIARVAAGRWDLHRLERQQPTLENVFLNYVRDAARRGGAS
jgi:hypothetical protein